MRFLITGCRGFIAGSFGRYVASQGHEVLGVGRTAQAPESWPGLYVAADVAHADLTPVVREFRPDAIFHGAGSASVAASFQVPPEDLRATLQTFSNTLEAVRRSDLAPLVIFPSSAAVYGMPESLPVEEDAPLRPLSPYGFHKVMCELLAQEYGACFGLRTLVCRLFSVYGPAQKRLLVHQLFAQLDGSVAEVRLEGTGEETRDYLFIDDLSAAILALVQREVQSPEKSGCLTVNVASGSATRILDLARLLAHLHGSGKTIATGSELRRGDPPHWQASIARLTERIGIPRARPLEEGLRACLRAWRP